MDQRQIVKLARRTHSAFQTAEQEWLSRKLEELADHHTVQCKVGCSHCCKQLPLGTLATGILIADQLLRTGSTLTLTNIEEQGDHQTETIKSYGFTDASQAWFDEHHVSCALLDVDQRCGVYDIRPPCCSSYFVVTPPALCEIARSKTKVGVLNALSMDQMALQLDLDLILALRINSDKKARVGPTGCLLSPVGRMVKLGRLLLEGETDKFLDVVASAPFAIQLLEGLED